MQTDEGPIPVIDALLIVAVLYNVWVTILLKMMMNFLELTMQRADVNPNPQETRLGASKDHPCWLQSKVPFGPFH